MATLRDKLSVGYFPLNSIAQVEDVATGQIPQPADGVWSDCAAKPLGQQDRDSLARQRLKVRPVELRVTAYVLHGGGDRCCQSCSRHQVHSGQPAALGEYLGVRPR